VIALSTEPRRRERPCVPRDPTEDHELFAALQRGEDAALNRLISRWEQPLFAFAWRYLHNQADAQDLVADTFVRLYQHRENLRQDTKLSAWLFTTLSNLCHNRHRWHRRHPTVSLDDPDISTAGSEPLAAGSGGAARLEQDEAQAALHAAIDRLPHDLRVTVLLHYFDRLSYREIGEVAGCSERGVETRLYRARQRLRAELESLQLFAF
jgi:RNA polymerase sigma-70 factor (ECF subfamily)